MPLGPNDIKSVIIPSAWDAAELQRISLRDGTTYDQLIADINAAITMFNSDLQTSWLASVMSPTTELGVEYGQGAGNAFEDATEYAQPDAQRGDTTGHMLPLRHLDYKLGWTNRWLEEARRVQIDNDIAIMLDAARDVFERRALTRLFKFEEETGRANGLGASGVSVPFCDGGNGTIAFTPRPVFDRATAFAGTHNHYLRLNGISQTNLTTAVKHLWEHGYDQPFELLVAQADVASWENTSNVSGYKPRGDTLITYGQDVTLAQVDDRYLGVVQTIYGTCRIMASARIPTNYWAVYKTFGPLDPRNPLRVRFDDFLGFGLRLVSERVELYPLAGAIPRFSFGVGVSDRTAAVLVENDSTGTYATPTIS